MIRKSLLTMLLPALVALAVPIVARAAPTEEIVLAGGCFWCVEADMESLRGVGDVVSGFTGGTEEDPDYEDVARGRTGHIEAVRVPFDPTVISLPQILDAFFRGIDPTDDGGQFCDRGPAYRSAIFVTPAQRPAAQAAKARAQAALDERVVTEILPASKFWPAGERHQDYYKSKKRIGFSLVGFGITRASAYTRYRAGCGRDARVREVWGDEALFADQ